MLDFVQLAPILLWIWFHSIAEYNWIQSFKYIWLDLMDWNVPLDSIDCAGKNASISSISKSPLTQMFQCWAEFFDYMLHHHGHVGGHLTKYFSLAPIVKTTDMAAMSLSFASWECLQSINIWIRFHLEFKKMFHIGRKLRERV